jgi:histidine triad (HIT) family protein
MYNHAPPGYICPFCLLIRGIENPDTQLKQTDIVFQSAEATALMATRNWPNNPGHVLVISNRHFENIYDLPVPVSIEIYSLSRRIAIAMKTEYGCDGITLQQSNEPARDQQIWHYHLHVITRYHNDDFRGARKESFPVDLRAIHARKLMLQLENKQEANL